MDTVTRAQMTTDRAGDTGAATREVASRPRPLKILHVIDSGGLYGAEKMLLNLAVECQRMGHKVLVGTIVAPHDAGDPLGNAAAKAGLEDIQFAMRDGFSVSGLRAILRFARESGINLIHSHGYKSNILLAVTPRCLRPCPMICTLHGWAATGRRSKLAFYEALANRLVARFDAVVVVSDALRRRLPRSCNAVYLIQNGIQLPPPKANIQTTMPTDPNGTCRILAAGRLSHEKGFDVLVQAIQILRDQGVIITATIAGEGPDRDVLRANVERAGLQGQINMPGYVEDLDSLFKQSDLFVLCSRTEGLPMVLLEAMSQHVPVIASAVGHVPEVLGRGEYGRLVPAGDCGALVASICSHLAESQASLKSRIARAATRVEDGYSVIAMAEAYEKVYEYCAHDN